MSEQWVSQCDTRIGPLEAEIARLRAALEAARPYVEHCAGGSSFAGTLLSEIDALVAKEKVL